MMTNVWSLRLGIQASFRKRLCKLRFLKVLSHGARILGYLKLCAQPDQRACIHDWFTMPRCTAQWQWVVGFWVCHLYFLVGVYFLWIVAVAVEYYWFTVTTGRKIAVNSLPVCLRITE